MNRYRLSMTIEDEVIADNSYKAFLTFRERFREGFYGPRQDDVEFVEEVLEEASEPESP